MKEIKGWRRLTHDCGYQNDTSDQTVAVLKKDFSQNYEVKLFESGKSEKEEGKTISPAFASKARADAFAGDWMQKHPKGTE
jgi:hypothetical protein